MTRIPAATTATVADRRDLATALGVDAPGEEVTWTSLAGRVESRSDAAFASSGSTLRAEFGDRLDPDLLERECENLAAELGRLPAVREAGVPDGPEGLYTEVAAPGWRLYDHFLEVGLFERLDEVLPRFTAENIEQTTRELVLTDPLSSALEEVGFDEAEKTALLSAVANNNERLARWVPSNQIPDEVEFDTSNVPPLHQRAMGGALLWIRGLDRHLWQNEVLVTEAILDDAVRHVKAMLGGTYVTATAARDLAADERFSDEQLTAAFTAGAAVQILYQEEVLHDVFYIRDEDRAPSELR